MGGASRHLNVLGVSLLSIALVLAFGSGIGIGDDKVGSNTHEIGSADVSPTVVQVGDSVHVEGTGMLANAQVLVLFGVRVSETVVFATEVGYAQSDAGGNWSINTQIPSSVQMYDENAVAATGGQAEAAGPDDVRSKAGLFGSKGFQQQKAAPGVSDGDWLAVWEGYWQFAGVTLGQDGGLYGTNSNFIEVTDNVVDDAGSSPGSSSYYTSSTGTSSAILPETGVPAIVTGLCGTGILAAGFILGKRRER